MHASEAVSKIHLYKSEAAARAAVVPQLRAGSTSTMQRITLFLLSAVLAVALAEGQYYVPRAYYTIDAEGHASAPVPLRRLRRHVNPGYYPGGANANANANAEANANSWGGGEANANANANADARANAGGYGAPGGWGLGGSYGSGKPLSVGQTRRQFGPVLGARSITASSSVGLDAAGAGYYDTSASAGI